MKLLIIIILLIPFSLYSQRNSQIQMHSTLEEALENLRNDSNVYDIELKHSSYGMPYITFLTKLDKPAIINALYFTKDKICYASSIYYPYSELNTLISHLNEKFVRESDYSWVDYSKKQNIYYVIEKMDQMFNIKISLKPN